MSYLDVSQTTGPGSKNFLISRSAQWNQKLNPTVNEEYNLVSKFVMNWQNDKETVEIRKAAQKANQGTYDLMMQEKTRKYNSSKPKTIVKEEEVHVV